MMRTDGSGEWNGQGNGDLIPNPLSVWPTICFSHRLHISRLERLEGSVGEKQTITFRQRGNVTNWPVWCQYRNLCGRTCPYFLSSVYTKRRLRLRQHQSFVLSEWWRKRTRREWVSAQYINISVNTMLKLTQTLMLTQTLTLRVNKALTQVQKFHVFWSSPSLQPTIRINLSTLWRNREAWLCRSETQLKCRLLVIVFRPRFV